LFYVIEQMGSVEPVVGQSTDQNINLIRSCLIRI
jgi:hypothetical protein